MNATYNRIIKLFRLCGMKRTMIEIYIIKHWPRLL